MATPSDEFRTDSAAGDTGRQMVRADLMGRHLHKTECGVGVHVWRRGGKFIGRGSYEGRRFGPTLGTAVAEAEAGLRQLLHDIESGTFVRPSEARHRPLSDGRVGRFTLRQLIDEFYAEKRKVRGLKTAGTYQSRLMPVLDFAEQKANLKRWPLAMSIDREFVLQLRTFLHQYRTTRNGRPGGVSKTLSVRQIANVLECFGSMLGWARHPSIRKLPADWANPVTPDLRVEPPAKDPFRESPIPSDHRVKLVANMDRWQLCQLALSFVLPLRPAEAAGLLVSEVRFDKRRLEFGTRAGGGDFTKGRTAFVLPFPDEVIPILQTCIAGRPEGPLLRSREAFDRPPARPVASPDELFALYENTLAVAPPGTVVTEQDRKSLFRRLLSELGGVREDRLATEFKALLRSSGLPPARFYDLRAAVTTDLGRTPGMPHLELRYLTSHTTADILNEYTGLDPVAAMQRYFATVRPLLEALAARSRLLGLTI